VASFVGEWCEIGYCERKLTVDKQRCLALQGIIPQGAPKIKEVTSQDVASFFVPFVQKGFEGAVV